jgi:hypothetical protein
MSFRRGTRRKLYTSIPDLHDGFASVQFSHFVRNDMFFVFITVKIGLFLTPIVILQGDFLDLTSFQKLATLNV